MLLSLLHLSELNYQKKCFLIQEHVALFDKQILDPGGKYIFSKEIIWSLSMFKLLLESKYNLLKLDSLSFVREFEALFFCEIL